MSLLEDLIRERFTIRDTTSRYAKTEEHDSLVLDRKRDIFFWNSRDLSGDAYIWLTEVLGYTPAEALHLIRKEHDGESYSASRHSKPVQEKFVTYPKLVDVFWEVGKDHRDYWHNKRGYNDKTIDDFRLGYTGEWYTIPIFVDGVFKNFQLRKENPKTIRPWYQTGERYPFNFSILKYTSWAIITEGPVDAIMLRQYDLPGVSQTAGSGSWNANWNPKFAHLKSLFVVYDNDDAGLFGAYKLAKQFGNRAKIYNFSGHSKGYDITDFFKDGGTSEDFTHILQKESKYYFELGL